MNISKKARESSGEPHPSVLREKKGSMIRATVSACNHSAAQICSVLSEDYSSWSDLSLVRSELLSEMPSEQYKVILLLSKKSSLWLEWSITCCRMDPIVSWQNQSQITPQHTVIFPW